jgi:hypothetical protein
MSSQNSTEHLFVIICYLNVSMRYHLAIQQTMSGKKR